MNVDEIKRNLQRGKKVIVEPEKKVKFSISSNEEGDEEYSRRPKFGKISSESDNEEEPPKPNSEIWEMNEKSPGSFFGIFNEEVPKTKMGRPKKSIINNGSSRPLREFPVDNFISENNLQEPQFDWRKDTNKGQKSRQNFSKYLKDFFEVDYYVNI